MSFSRGAVGVDRLPWLADEPQPRSEQNYRELIGWGLAAAVLVAGASYRMGANTEFQPAAVFDGRRPAAEATMSLPEARPARVEAAPASAEPMVAAPPQPQVKLERPSALAAPAPAVRVPRRVAPAAAAEVESVQPAVTEKQPAKLDPYAVWPARVVDGAHGRLVRIGAFATPRQAKKGWWAIVRNNPALQRLPAVVVPVPSMRNGKTYYRLQMGTSSQAHSEVLCQRMRMIAQGCVVVGLPNGPALGRAP